MRLRHVTKHYLTGDGWGISHRLPVLAQRFWRRSGLCPAEEAIVATHEGKLVGFFRYDVYRSGSLLGACGTWVAPDFRRQGLGTRMWQMALRRGYRQQRRRGWKGKEPKVEVVCATRAGGEFVSSLNLRDVMAFRNYN